MIIQVFLKVSILEKNSGFLSDPDWQNQVNKFI